MKKKKLKNLNLKKETISRLKQTQTKGGAILLLPNTHAQLCKKSIDYSCGYCF